MSTTDPLINKKLGDYKIESLLGRGGMARVYQGYDENLDRYAAVKVIDHQLIADDDHDEYYERFQREARSIARLRHPNIVSIYQFGEVDGNYYMAMVFIQGQDLRQIIKKHNKDGTRMSNALVLKIMRAMANALDYAHREGVIHRDVKPSNIMVTSDGTAILTDFGLALNVPEGTIGNTFGSAHYIAPEQAVSSAQAVPQSDLYSLGICLYEMLTGRVPFDDNSAMSVALKHLSDPPPPPSQLNPDISFAVEQVLFKILEKEPEDRYETGAELVNALERAFALSDDEDTHDLDVNSGAVAISGARSQAPTSINTEASIPRPTATTHGSDSSHSMRRTATFSQVPAPKVNITSAKLKQLENDDIRSNAQRGVVIGAVALLVAAVLALLAFMALGNNQQQSEVATQTVVAAAIQSEEPTETETDLPTATERPTNTAEPTTPPPTSTAVPTASAAVVVEASATPTRVLNTVTLYYDERTLVLFNSSVRTVNVSNLIFSRVLESGREVRFNSNRWENGTRPPSALPSNDCFQMWTTNFSVLQTEDYCSLRHRWIAVSPSNAFWVSADPGQTFIVRRNDEVLATCEIDAGECQVILPSNTN